MRRVSLFVYGTLLDAPTLRAVLGRPAPLQPARLTGYQRRALRGLAYPGIVRQRGATTTGAVVHVSGRELHRLDRYEDDHYERRQVSVDLNDGRRIGAQTYLLLRRDHRLAGRVVTAGIQSGKLGVHNRGR